MSAEQGEGPTVEHEQLAPGYGGPIGEQMTVRVGDTVRYLHRNLDRDLAGIVTCVHSEDCVNLWIPPDGTYPNSINGPQTSVMRREGGPGSPVEFSCWDFR